MYRFFEKSMEGGILYISKRYSKANNKSLKSFDPIQEEKDIIYLDANNLYGYAMYKVLPTGGCKWTDRKYFTSNTYSSNSSKGAVLEVDLEYPRKLEELHKDYSLAPGKIETKKELLSNYKLSTGHFYNNSIGNIKKLVLNFFDKEKYMLQYETYSFI